MPRRPIRPVHPASVAGSTGPHSECGVADRPCRRRRWSGTVAAALAWTGVLAGSAAAGAVPRAEVYLPVRITAENRTGGPLECQAVAGHWYSFDLGTGAAAQTMAFDMAVDPKTGTVVMWNSAHDPVPIETVFCGIGGKAWDTRFAFPLRHIAETAEAGRASAFVCEAAAGRVECR